MEKGKQKEKLKNDSVAKDKILLAALKLFTEKGYFNTSLTDIVKASGLKSTNSIYKHFKNKQAIADALYGNILDSLNCSIDDIRRRNKKFSDQLREVTGLLFALTDEAPEVMKFLLLIQHQEFLPDEKLLQDTAPFVKLKKIIQAGIKSGEIKAIDALRAYTYFFGVINNTLKMVLSGELDKKAEVYQSETWVTAWHCIARK